MPEQLRPFLFAIVLLNLTLVQATGSVAGPWMAGLWILTLAAPLLERLRENVLYRLAWNLAVVVAFAFLVHHAMTTGLLHMLEDGMLLAALCQVHLLNNVGRKQRPDLLFFNSFLITFVTSFFSHDLVWSLGFVAYAAVLVPALQLHVALPREGSLDRRHVRAVLRDSAPRALQGLLLTAAVFVLWPRNFRHEGWLSETLSFANPQLVAFAEEIRLDRSTTPTLGELPVMRIKPLQQGTVPPQRWRGVTFVRFDGSGWLPYRVREFGTRLATDVQWSSDAPRQWTRPSEETGRAEYEVRLLDPSGRRLFAPLDAVSLTMQRFGEDVMVDPKADGIVGFDPTGSGRGELRYTVGTGSVPPRNRPTVSHKSTALLRQLPPDLPRELVTMASSLRAKAGANATEEQIAQHTSDWLAEHRQYALPGTSGAARNLGEFLLATGAGHCEYFATTLALLLRLQGLPCRIVGGYLAHETDDSTGEIVVRQKDAHAWVEVLLPTVGWTTFDATPSAALRREPAATSWYESVLRQIEEAWLLVTSFDEHKRARLYGWVAGLPAAIAAAAHTRPWLPGGAILLLVAWLHLRRQARREPDTIAELRRALRRLRVRAVKGETPREVLQRAFAAVEPGPARDRLAAAVAAHERARYGTSGRQRTAPQRSASTLAT